MEKVAKYARCAETCLKRPMFTHDLKKTAIKQLELVKERGLDISSCNVGVIDFDLNKSTTILKVMHMLEDNDKRNNEFVHKILDVSM